jgi:adenine-specific DNA-methyltransferase
MRIATKTRAEEEQALALTRRLGDLRAIASRLKRARMTPLQVCEAIIDKRFAERTVREFFADLPDDEGHYWIASLYALLMPKARRKRLAAYFTPPHLAYHAIRVMMDAGIRPGHHRILDPASGGAAFLVPLAAQIAEAGHKRGARAKTILQDIQRSLRGVEIDAGLAGLPQALLADLLHDEIENSGIELDGLAHLNRINSRASPCDVETFPESVSAFPDCKLPLPSSAPRD